jgi:hypothetical protein
VEVIEITPAVEKGIERRLKSSRAPEVIIEHAGRESWRPDSQLIKSQAIKTSGKAELE